MNENTKKLLQNVCLRNSSDGDDDETVDDTSVINNTPMSSPLHIPSGFIGKRNSNKKKQPPPSIHHKRIKRKVKALPAKLKTHKSVAHSSEVKSSNDLPPSSPIPPMSPETTKLFNILVCTEVFENESENSAYNTKNPSNEELAEKNACNSFSLTPTTIPESMPPSVEEPGEKSIEAPPCSPLTPRPTRSSRTVKDTLVPATGSDLVLLPVEDPGEKSIEAPPCSPLTPRPTRSSRTVKDTLVPATGSDLVLLPVEDPGEKSIEAPPYSPLTPRPTRSSRTVKDTLVPATGSDLVLLPVEDPGEKSIEAPPYSPLTPRPTRSSRTVKDTLVPATGSDLVLLPVEDPGEKSIEAPPYSPLTPRPTRSSQKQNVINLPPETSSVSEESDYNCGNHDDKICNSQESISLIASYCSDDSGQDPDFNCDEDGDKISSDGNSETSVSLIRSQLLLHIEDPGCGDSDATDAESEPTVNEDVESENRSVLNLISPEPYAGRPRKGRKRKYGNLTREERKRRKYSNLPYVNSKNKSVGPKPFLDYKCSCTKKCHELISVEKRLFEFKKFYALGTYNSQNMYLAACVKEQPVKRSYVTTNTTNVSKKKTFSRQYLLQGTSVCREMFVKTLQTTPKRINTSLCKIRSDDCITDKRGQQAGKNKLAPELEQFLINVIKKLPTYTSHYRRNECNDAKFLRPDMTFPKIYDLYCKEAALAQIQTVSYAKAKQVFVTKFNLRTKPLKKDTCNKCDFFESQKKNASEEDKVEIEEDHAAHLKGAKSLQTQLKKDMLLAKNDEYTETITYDLEKTLPLPRIPTNIVFYKRQLWVYNLGIHTGSDDQAHCNVWVECEAGRGAQEVGSCLIKHASQRLKPKVKHLILWSDSCGGQNRNIKLTLMLKAFLSNHPTLERISLRFLESGHSFLPNDTDFGRIECALKLQQRIYTPEDYIEIMKNCKKNKPMNVHRMQKEDFISSSKLENIITNRKKAEDGSKVSWLKTKEIVLNKESMFKLFMRTDLEEDYIEVNIKKNSRGRQALLSKELMEPLWPLGKPIPTAKLQDLKSLLHLIPKDAQDFYKHITSDDNIEDDVDGFSGVPDFELEDFD